MKGIDEFDIGPWRRIWKLKVHEKIRFFLWLVRHDALPTNEKRHRNHLSITAVFPSCDGELEDLQHLFRDCPQVRGVSLRFGAAILGVDTNEDFQAWLSCLIASRHHLLCIAILWWAWRWRNNKTFSEDEWHLNQVLRTILLDVASWRTMLSNQPEGGSTSTSRLNTNARIDVQVHVDESWVTGLGRMGMAAVLRSPEGTWRSTIVDNNTGGSSFLAELTSIKLGLEHAWGIGYRNIFCNSDCPQAIEVLQTMMNIDTFWDKEEILKVRQLLQRDWRVSLNCISREKNNTADHLAKLVAREGSFQRIWRQPPSSVYASMYLDALVLFCVYFSYCNKKNIHINM